MNLANKTVLVADLGLFSCFAEALVPHFGRVLYWTPWTEAFPRDSALQIGANLPGVERVDYWEPLIDDVDLWVFPDCYFGPMQCMLEKRLGKRVWGARMAEELELHREESKLTMRQAGIPIGDFAVVEGVDELRAYLKEHDNQRVKISFTRGDQESFHAQSYRLVEPVLDDLEERLGPRKNHRTFICEDSIDDAVEIAYDGYTVDGEFPSRAMWGLEVKSSGYFGHFTNYDDMPEQLKSCNEKIAPLLKKYRCRSWFGMETRVTKDGKGWVIDPLARTGNPPGALCTLMYDNLAEILWEGAAGNLVDPEPAGEYGCQIIIHSDWSARHWQPVYYPPKLDPYVKLVNHTIIDGTHYVIPGPDLNTAVGSIVAVGPSVDAAIAKCVEYAEQVEGHNLQIESECVPKAKEELGKLEKYGLKF